MRLRHNGETHLKRKIDFTGTRERMSTTLSSVSPTTPAAVEAELVTARLRFFFVSRATFVADWLETLSSKPSRKSIC
jgi:hypothetical protein